jgi:tetratricopeptide (TPR) repeat protein
MPEDKLATLRNGVTENIEIPTFSDNRSEAYYVRGVAQAKSGRNKDALENLNKAIELDPVFAPAHFSRGLVRSSEGLQKEALVDMDNAITLNEFYKEAFYVRGLIYQALSNTDKGCLDLSRAGELGYIQAYDVIKNLCN